MDSTISSHFIPSKTVQTIHTDHNLRPYRKQAHTDITVMDISFLLRHSAVSDSYPGSFVGRASQRG